MVIPTLTQSFETTLIQIFPKIIWCLCVLLPLLTITSKPYLIQVHQIRPCSVKLIPISAWSCPGSLHPPTKPPQNFCCVYLWNLPFYLFFQPTHTPPFTQWSLIKNPYFFLWNTGLIMFMSCTKSIQILLEKHKIHHI